MVRREGLLIAGALIVAVVLLGGGLKFSDDNAQVSDSDLEEQNTLFGFLIATTEKKPAIVEISCEAELLRKGYDNESAMQLCEIRARNE